MLADHFSVLGLRLRTPRLELRVPDDDDLSAMIEVALRGVHPPEVMPFRIPWTDQEPVELARGLAQHHWRMRAEWRPDSWCLLLCVVHDGVVVGSQDLQSRAFAVTREVSSASWLGQAHQGQGIGTEMRAAVLHLAFAGLGAREAVSAATEGNAASLAVSRKLGYAPDGIQRDVVRGEAVVEQRLRLTRADWERHRTVDVTIDGLAPSLPLFGL
ncbi:GNAT family N-acetyltransferase [Saccharomonospora piscinae]|uniref:GNAT family N-acetyltransferase n=1 Tax=Saccharomonospora piscinae TaxID=687388 RepID=UPI00046790AA|nr:GNAT family protein [Saccharomonospora piscinae]